jgi:hypothetical protein
VETEPSFEEIVSARKDSAAASLRFATPEEVRRTLDEIFSADPLHPWFESFTRFVEDHKDESATVEKPRMATASCFIQGRAGECGIASTRGSPVSVSSARMPSNFSFNL